MIPLDAHLRLCLVTDERMYKDNRSLLKKVRLACMGGVSMVQLREKQSTTKQFLERALLLKDLLLDFKVPLIINDRVDIALAADAEGVHLGQSDLPASYARKLLGPDKIIGLSVENEDHAYEANRQAIDYVGLSPVFSTTTKLDTAPPLGLSGVAKIAKICKVPTIGIGGVNLENVGSLIQAGAVGAAVVSYLMQAEAIDEAAKAMNFKIRRFRN